MKPAILLKALQETPFFEEFDPEDLDYLCESEIFFQNFKRGANVRHQGEPSQTLGVIIQGTLSLVKDEDFDHPIGKLTAGSVFGETSFQEPEIPVATMIAEEPSTIFLISRDNFQSMDALVREKIQQQLILVLLDRLENMNKALLKLMTCVR